MVKLAPLSLKDFRNRTWKRNEDFQFAAKDQVVPLVAAELATAAPEMPIGFLKNGDRFVLAALLSYRSNDNFYVSPNGNWLVRYIPIALRARPFCIVRPKDSDKTVLCVDEDVCSPGEEIFFDKEGNVSKAVQNVMQLLEFFERNRQATAVAVTALVEARLIVPWEINVRRGEQVVPLDGLYKLDEDRLNRLPNDNFLNLRKLGAIPLAYAQLLSMQQLHLLSKLEEIQNKLRTDPKLQIPATQFNEMFKLDDGTLPF